MLGGVHGENHVGRNQQPPPARQPLIESSSLSQASPIDAMWAEKSCPSQTDF